MFINIFIIIFLNIDIDFLFNNFFIDKNNILNILNIFNTFFFTFYKIFKYLSIYLNFYLTQFYIIFIYSNMSNILIQNCIKYFLNFKKYLIQFCIYFIKRIIKKKR